MRYVRCEHQGRTVIARAAGDRLQPVAAPDLATLARGEGGDPVGAPFSAAEARLLAPLRPGKIVAVGRNYAAHAHEQGAAPPAEPLLFAKLPSAVIGPDAPIRWPAGLTDAVDIEVELAVVIGSGGRDIHADAAERAIFGYTVANDVTARDLQRRDGQWTRAKGLDTFCPLGPAVVTRDEIPDPQALTLTSSVDGEIWQRGSTADMMAGVFTLVAYVSRAFTLEPGDVILTGTPPGVGAYQDPPRFLAPGQRIAVEIDAIGRLENPVGPNL